MPHDSSPLDFIAPNSRAVPRPKDPSSPYFGVDPEEWREVTAELISEHPLDPRILRDAVLQSWDDIFESSIGLGRIGAGIDPDPQIMGYLLHELIPVRISAESREWRKDSASDEKDLVYVPNPSYSIEIKSSTNAMQIFGNRSYGVERTEDGRGRQLKKAKSGYYCAINFERWVDAPGRRPEIRRIRFGWIDSTDWVAQRAETGQASTLPRAVYANQLAVIYSR
ncbi:MULTISPECIES: ScaI family restriction endonuclease [unclassified Curtobacterium]|uniref:ScaI family restriction endonuclease n=1 Tax=unclassified Curtobacterium TaxID=257496 RepID=UPI0015E887A7|nr:MULTISPECIES: ScaI family restriction endonuclease [unclassified Curtobacterium]